MIKYILCLCTVIAITSCRKDKQPHTPLRAGSELNVKITNHNVKIKGVYDYFNVDIKKDFLSIDITGDSIPDISLTSNVDSVKSLSTPRSYVCELNILDTNLTIAKIPESGSRYEHYHPLTYDQEGIFPVVIYKIEILCDSLFESHRKNYFDRPQLYTYNEYINENEGWNKSMYLRILQTDIHTKFASPSINGDTLIMEDYFRQGDCIPFEQNTIHYLAFRKTTGPIKKYGWIEFEIRDNNEIIIYRSAIEV